VKKPVQSLRFAAGRRKNRFGADHLNWSENGEPKHEAVQIILPLEVESISLFVHRFTHLESTT
jgi:hypothetical protein